jgi:hypothetical protein
MPLVFRQFYGIIGHIGVQFIVKLGLVLAILLNWRKPFYRYALYAWLLFMLAENILWMGARTELILTLMAIAVMYHQFVKPLRLKMVVACGLALFTAFILIGVMRGSANLNANVENFRTTLDSTENIYAGSNEFQALFGGNYDLLRMRQTGLLDEPPLQFRLYDFVMIIPQQVLPFEKLEVQDWVSSRSNNPSFFMFNPISQAIIGFGWIEVIFRGALLGFFFAKLRAWYIRRSSSFWATLLYFYIIIISYYTIRSTALYIVLVSIAFRFLPLYFLIKFLTGLRSNSTSSVSLSSKTVDA